MVKIKFDLSHLTSGLVTPLLILIILVVGYFQLLPKYKDLKESRRILSEKEKEVALKAAQLSQVENLIADNKRKEQELEVLEEALPSAPRVPEILANIDALTQASGLLPANLQITIPPTLTQAGSGQDASQSKQIPGISGTIQDLAVLQIDLVLKGQYANLRTFLANLEQNLRLMDILSLTFTPVKSETQTQDFALKIQTYYYKPSS